MSPAPDRLPFPAACDRRAIDEHLAEIAHSLGTTRDLLRRSRESCDDAAERYAETHQRCRETQALLRLPLTP
jgi:hypothetical protein